MNNINDLKVSIIIPTYNRANLLPRAIESVQNQIYKPSQIIVVDDGSNDNTQGVLEQFDNIYIIKTTNLGVSNARNIGIQHAKHDWIAFLDSDDEWKIDKLQKQIQFHIQNSHIKVSYTNETWMMNNKIINKGKSNKKYGGHIFNQAIKKCFVGASTVLIHKSVFEDIGVFDTSLKVCEDYDLWIRISDKYEIGYIENELITKYAGHENQLSFTNHSMDVQRIQALQKHLNGKNHQIVKEEIINKLREPLKIAPNPSKTII